MFDKIKQLNITETISSVNVSNSNAQVKLYPNPADKIIQINADFKIEGISVFNVFGQKLFLLKNPQSKRIDISALNTGIYIIEIESNNKKIVKRFIKE